MFSVATNYDNELPVQLMDLDVHELFGACDDSPLGHGRPRVLTPPTSWRQFAGHVARCRHAGLGFNLLLNPLCLGGQEGSLSLERKVRRTLRRAEDLGVTAVTVAHPWLVELGKEYKLHIRVSVFVGISTEEQARYWEDLGAHVLALDTHVLCRDLPAIGRIVKALSRAEVELPVNVGCILRCPLARTHAARLSHSSVPGAQPVDPCALWCLALKRQDPFHLVRSDFIRPEDTERYRQVGVKRFKVADRCCSTEVLVERVRAYANRRWDGDLLALIGPRGLPPRKRLLPVWDALRSLGLWRAWHAWRHADRMMDTSMPWVVDNLALDGLLKPNGCSATQCQECGHCALLARKAVRPRSATVTEGARPQLRQG